MSKWSKIQRIAFEKRYPLNRDFFITYSSELFYFLGYIAGDGGVCVNGEVYVSSIKDGYIIEKFRDLIVPNHSVGPDIKGVYRISINRPECTNFVSSFDVKSPSIFSRVPRCYLPDFIRGFMDSDGTVRLRKQKTCYSTEVFFPQKSRIYIEALQALLLSWNLRCSAVKRKPDQELWYFSLGTLDGLLLLSKLYRNKGIFYNSRKFNNYVLVNQSRSSNMAIGFVHDHYRRRDARK